ncbi:GTP-binding protein, partial [bacterium]|nr:GTP-binding protein [bacterium]
MRVITACLNVRRDGTGQPRAVAISTEARQAEACPTDPAGQLRPERTLSERRATTGGFQERLVPDVIPKVVVVGRPNVGKSSLFNWLVGKRIAIEDPTAGVTRDRLVQRIELDGRIVDLVDTGGMGFDDPDGLTRQIDAQIESGLAEAAVVVFVVEVRSGLLPADRDV